MKIKRSIACICNCGMSLLRMIWHRNFLLYNNLKKLKTNCDNRKLYILGNGSSLVDADLGNSSSIDYMVVNRHVLSDDYFKKKPKYYVLADPHFFIHEEGLSILDAIINKTTWGMTLFVPHCREFEKAVLQHMAMNSKVKCIFYNNMDLETGIGWFDKWTYMHNMCMPRVQNVMVAAITIGTFLGYKEIDIYGVEHSWTKSLFVNDDNEVCLLNTHFYDTGKIEAKTWKEIQHEDATIGEVLHMYGNMFDSYHQVKKIALWNNVVVINKTKNSFIDAFRRK